MRTYLSRRDFLRNTSLASASLFIPRFLRASGTMSFADAGKPKILVVIQLSGGNDGLNTVVPFRNDIYYEKRPVIGLNPDELIKIADDTGLHPALSGLADLYHNGDAVIINSVGYP
nr:twin-arginine translocation pathway signal [Chitinophagales bacterium]